MPGEGPYRDLGCGFARLTGLEGVRRTPSRIFTVEDAAAELVRNARDAGADRIYVASILKGRRYRTLTVLDNGCGIPDTYLESVFEPGVTTRHLNPVRDSRGVHGAGLSLYHIHCLALKASILSACNPTAVQVTFDTSSLPERSLQSPNRPSETNLLATLSGFLREEHSKSISLFYGSPSRILAQLIMDRLILHGKDTSSRKLKEEADRLGLNTSLRTVQRILSRATPAAISLSAKEDVNKDRVKRKRTKDGPRLHLTSTDLSRITEVLKSAAVACFMEVEEVEYEAKPGSVTLKARIYEPEGEYE